MLDTFGTATWVRPLGDGTFAGELHPDWAVGGRPHGGYLLAVIANAAIGDSGLAPLAVSSQFLRPPKIGPVLVRVEALKSGRTVTVVRAVLEQSGRTCVDSTVTLGHVSEDKTTWADVPDMPVNPSADAVDIGASESGKFFGLSRTCDVRLDPDGAGFLAGSTDHPPRLRLWVRPRSAQPDLLFSLVAGDISPPVTFNLGRFGWSPTVQLTALLRARPANGWLRLVVESKTVNGQWFDEDALVIDSTGRIVCQARQLALTAVGN